VLNCLRFGMGPAEAVAAPRFHHQWMPRRLDFEDDWTVVETIDALQRMGYETGRREGIGDVQLILVGDDGLRAASDPRRGGAPAGY
jgi:gamma-glutamyltranspeptidase/glutathione hydrolase